MPGRLVQGEKLGLHFQIEYVMQSDNGHSEGALISSDTICFLEWNEKFRNFVPCTPQDDLVNVDELWIERGHPILGGDVDRLVRVIRNGSSRQRDFIRKYVIADVPDAERSRLLRAFDELASKSGSSHNKSS